MKRSGRYRKVAINVLLAIAISVVLNFSYLVFMAIGVNREPAPEKPTKATTVQVATEQESAPTATLSEAPAREVIPQEQILTPQNSRRSNLHPMATRKGAMSILAVELVFYVVVTMLFLTIMTASRGKRRGHFYARVLMALCVLVACYFLAPQIHWDGKISILANSRHLIHPMTLLKIMVSFIVAVLYGKIYDLIYAKQSIEMENERLKNENLTWQYNTLVNQVNPHFLFNSLNSLSMLVRESKNDDAITYISQMSDTYRYIMEEGKQELTSVKNELSFLEAYRYLLEIRYSGKLHIVTDIPKELYSQRIPPLSIQPLIENAVKHNTITSSQPLTISITSDGDHIIVSNPIRPKLQPETSTNIGLRNLSNRYELIVGRKVEVSRENGEFVVKLPLNKSTK